MVRVYRDTAQKLKKIAKCLNTSQTKFLEELVNELWLVFEQYTRANTTFKVKSFNHAELGEVTKVIVYVNGKQVPQPLTGGISAPINVSDNEADELVRQKVEPLFNAKNGEKK